jgi:hypothetical protein
MKAKILIGLTLLLAPWMFWQIHLRSNKELSNVYSKGPADKRPSNFRSKQAEIQNILKEHASKEKFAISQENSLSAEEQRTESTATELAEIEKLMEERDGKLVSTLLSKMENPSKEIRQAALDGIMLIDDSTAASELRKIAKTMSDSEESAAIIHSADFLELPPAKLNFKSPTDVNPDPHSHP